MNNYFTDPHWETVYICSVCGEHSSTKSKECPFCHHEMQNYEGSIYGKSNAFISSRFQIIEYSENFFGFESVIVDKETGVLYLWTKVGYGAGLTPLLDSEGNVQFYDGKR